MTRETIFTSTPPSIPDSNEDEMKVSTESSSSSFSSHSPLRHRSLNSIPEKKHSEDIGVIEDADEYPRSTNCDVERQLMMCFIFTGIFALLPGYPLYRVFSIYNTLGNVLVLPHFYLSILYVVNLFLFMDAISSYHGYSFRGSPIWIKTHMSKMLCGWILLGLVCLFSVEVGTQGKNAFDALVYIFCILLHFFNELYN